jgi:hypothetical protein
MKNEIEIDWENYNYPPLMRVIHFDPEDFHDREIKNLLKRMSVIPIMITSICFLNSKNFFNF